MAADENHLLKLYQIQEEMSMYDFLKILQTAAESVGIIEDVRMCSNDKYWGNQVKISGTTNSGQTFELELTIKEATADDRN